MFFFSGGGVAAKTKMFTEAASETFEAKKEAVLKKVEYERKRSAFETKSTTSSQLDPQVKEKFDAF